MTRFVAEQHLPGAQFTAIGAFSEVTLAWFDWEAKDYEDIPIDEQVEVLTLPRRAAQGAARGLRPGAHLGDQERAPSRAPLRGAPRLSATRGVALRSPADSIGDLGDCPGTSRP